MKRLTLLIASFVSGMASRSKLSWAKGKTDFNRVLANSFVKRKHRKLIVNRAGEQG